MCSPSCRRSVRAQSERSLLAAGLALESSLITCQHLARDLLRSPGDDRLDGVIADVFTRDVIDGPEPPPVMLNFQTHLGAPVFRNAAHALARLAGVRFQTAVPFFFVQHGVISPAPHLAGHSLLMIFAPGRFAAQCERGRAPAPSNNTVERSDNSHCRRSETFSQVTVEYSRSLLAALPFQARNLAVSRRM
jgi:hypothetical protein